METKVKDMTKKLKNEQGELDKWKKTEKDAQDRIDEDAKHLEKFATKQNLLEQKVSECVEKINQLGALPADDLYSHYVKFSSRAVSVEKLKSFLSLKSILF